MNVIAVELSELTQKVTHVIPVSDNGGSTSEIVRVLGGPAVGDLRSRCLRVTDESTPEAVAVKALLGHRLHPTDSALARDEWYKIQEGDHEIWNGIGQDYANIIRRFLVHFHQPLAFHRKHPYSQLLLLLSIRRVTFLFPSKQRRLVGVEE